ncbi:MAG: hypothetical protein AUJ57_00425 [Zetaproteobacteria bacterium CG1_02_53_45]|nr:MAG: hypothetical protein AUJ57_09640 [Zetaproteobacteria bacterium CG1_02_53_45]OIO69127.1 MAG: hypothetical protein AUJ57_09545 [Zetaproteobacteria bacterium CG1_02_53_45]OIO74842.1 MAG: hypothetical protein AUJ57_01385 [Zetaproteobacteria bacterium CG1_02_53_45]OIO75256.1 MAG: hypothetical protein AUJ57_00425 [Zetaproteobacteria bacterium CG1_02_53_45]
MHQCKRVYAVFRLLYRNGVSQTGAWCTALSGKGWWRLSKTPAAHRAMNLEWFKDNGLQSLAERWLRYQQT